MLPSGARAPSCAPRGRRRRPLVAPPLGALQQGDLWGLPPEVRWKGLRALWRLGERAVPTLTQALRDEDPAVREFAADALGRIGPAAEAAVPELLRAIAGDFDSSVRQAAARALAAIGSGAARA